jgi:hypothetical protein
MLLVCARRCRHYGRETEVFKVIAANRSPDSSWVPHFGSVGGAWPKIVES